MASAWLDAASGTRSRRVPMASPTSAERTTFSLDVLGRYVCNGLDVDRFLEALHTYPRAIVSTTHTRTRARA